MQSIEVNKNAGRPSDSLSNARRLSGIERDSLSGGYSEREPPDPISNSVVKPFSADDSVG
jgi:hypothetical protein